MLFRIITWLIVIGIIYRVITRFIFPVAHITSATNDRLKKMQEQINEMNRKAARQNEPTDRKKQVKKEGDYIDYEEINP